jgi:ketosteroid isomerase-like protein
MASKTDVLKERYERLSRGDLEGAVDLWADDFVWDGDDSGLPGSGRYVGKQAAIEVVLDTIRAYDTFAMSVDQFVEEDDTVVVLAHMDVSKGDRSARLPVVHIWRYRGDEICRMQPLSDTLRTAQTLGLVSAAIA